jgi:hypothetical protein
VTPRRVVHHADAIAWLGAQPRLCAASVITSLPDLSELPGLSFEAWRDWFSAAAGLSASRVSDGGAAIFFQSDVLRAGRWVDKAGLVARAAEGAGMSLAFHKIVCRLPPGTLSFGRPSYSHLLGYVWPDHPVCSATPRADVLVDAGFKPAGKSMGVNACVEACRFVLSETHTRTVVDPFCGFGTVLSVANALGLDAVGVDLSRRMCQRARRLKVVLSAGSIGRGQRQPAE